MALSVRPIRDFEPGWYRFKSSHRARQRLVQADELIAGAREPQRLAHIGIDDDMGRQRAKLLPGIEHPGRADAVDP